MDITTFRRHVVRPIGKFCSWSGHVHPFTDQAEAQRVIGVINRAGERSGVEGHPASNRAPTFVTNKAGFAMRIRQLRMNSTSASSTVISQEHTDATPHSTISDLVDWDPTDLDEFFTRTADGVTHTADATLVPKQDATCQAEPLQRTRGVQTPSGDPLLLPPSWGVHRLVELAAAEPLQSPRQLANRVSILLGYSLPPALLTNVELYSRLRRKHVVTWWNKYGPIIVNYVILCNKGNRLMRRNRCSKTGQTN